MEKIDHSDNLLLDAWFRHRSESAFRTLVERYAGLVHMAAMRSCGNHAMAAEAAQATFITLAEKAGYLNSRGSIAGWLHVTAVMQTKNLLRKHQRESRKIEHLREQMENHTPGQEAEDWSHISPVLDEALSHLPTKDREALLLRYYRSLSIQEVASVLGIAQAAAQKRVLRATERLRLLFGRRGLRLTGSLGVVLAAGFHADAQACQPFVSTLTTKVLATAGSAQSAGLAANLLILMTKKATIITGSILLLSGLGTAVYLNDRHPSGSNGAEKAKSTKEHSATVSNPRDNRTSGIRGSQTRTNAENPLFVSKYGLGRTALSKRLGREVVGLLESALKDDQESIADLKNGGEPLMARLVLERSLGLTASGVNLNDRQWDEVLKLYLGHAASQAERNAEAMHKLREDPEILMEFLLAADDLARGNGESPEFARLQAVINDELQGFGETAEYLRSFGIVTVNSGPLAKPEFLAAYKGILDAEQGKALDAYLDKHREELAGTAATNTPKGLRLEALDQALASLRKMNEGMDRILDSMGASEEGAVDDIPSKPDRGNP